MEIFEQIIQKLLKQHPSINFLLLRFVDFKLWAKIYLFQGGISLNVSTF